MGSLEEEAKVWLNREGGGGAVGSKFGQLVVSHVLSFPGSSAI